MKKNWIGRGIALGLTAVMTLGLCACGGGGKSMENAEMAKENVFKMSQIELPGLEKKTEDNLERNISVMQSRRVGDRIYLILRTDIWGMVNDAYENRTEYALINMDLTGGDQKRTEIQVPDPRRDAEDDVDVPVEPLVPEDAAASEEDQPEDAVEEPQYSEYVNYGNFQISAEGVLYGIKNCNREKYTEEEGYSSQQIYSLCRWGEDGNLLWEKEVFTGSSDEWSYLDSVIPLADGRIALMIRGDSNSRVIVDTEGNASPREALSEELEKIFNNVERSLVRDDGTLLVLYYEENDWQKTLCVDYDLMNDRLGEPKELPSSILYAWDYNVMYVRANGDLIFSTSSGIYAYTMGDKESRPYMDYINSDVFINVMYALVDVSEDSFLALYSESWEDPLCAAVFTYVDPKTIQDKAVIVLAGQYVDYETKKRAIEFNRNSEEYRIVVKEYSVYNNYEDYRAGITKLNNDIITGHMPDILVNSEYNSLPIENYIAKGWIADISKLIQEDEELSQKEFAQNVFDAYSQDGRLYYVVPNFEVYTMMAKKALVGDRPTWTMDDMQQVLAGMGEEARAFGRDMTKEVFMNMVMRYCSNQFIDVATGKCSFDSDNFIRMMEFTQNLPEEIVYEDDYWQNYDWSKEQAQYRENRTLMMQANLYEFSGLSRMINGYFGEPVSFVGFPTEDGDGSYIQSSQTFALAAKSGNLDGAWQFVRYYLTDEYQKDVSYFPVNLEMLREKSKDAMEQPYYIDENGEKEYYPQTMYINGEEIAIDPLNQEQLDQVMEFILSVNKHYYSNEFVSNIVSEEMGAFYAGQKSARDVAGVIQSRAQVYVDENR